MGLGGLPDSQCNEAGRHHQLGRLRGYAAKRSVHPSDISYKPLTLPPLLSDF